MSGVRSPELWSLQAGVGAGELLRLAHLHAALDQLVDVQEGLLEQLHGVGENAHKALFLQDEEAMRAVPTVHRCHRLSQLTQHLLHAVAVVFVLPARQTDTSSHAAGLGDVEQRLVEGQVSCAVSGP